MVYGKPLNASYGGYALVKGQVQQLVANALIGLRTFALIGFGTFPRILQRWRFSKASPRRGDLIFASEGIAMTSELGDMKECLMVRHTPVTPA